MATQVQYNIYLSFLLYPKDPKFDLRLPSELSYAGTYIISTHLIFAQLSPSKQRRPCVNTEECLSQPHVLKRADEVTCGKPSHPAVFLALPSTPMSRRFVPFVKRR
jgi:hypothetical protein